ncbi:hypothetical protein ABIE26_002841 [Pedobacter africanus]|uniref:Uncharacterized protein n=1 Tax=Pedobacter africanus TaxID=151894 RepID=A0ACC6KX65_9SPHI|nr:MauE/DoxX family redox-associated membrane protein [Pedobacter africanus]MDR6783770.1 hypothetical protein [Pedobacter africanus]
MKTSVFYRWFVELICWAFFILYVYAAASKLMAYDKFVVQIGQSVMLTPYAGVLVWLVPFIELVLAVMVQFNRFRLWGLYGSFGLMVMFTGYIVIVLHFMEDVPCSCGGILERLGWEAHLVFNISFMILGIIGIVLQDILWPIGSGRR